MKSLSIDLLLLILVSISFYAGLSFERDRKRLIENIHILNDWALYRSRLYRVALVRWRAWRNPKGDIEDRRRRALLNVYGKSRTFTCDRCGERTRCLSVFDNYNLDHLDGTISGSCLEEK